MPKKNRHTSVSFLFTNLQSLPPKKYRFNLLPISFLFFLESKSRLQNKSHEIEELCDGKILRRYDG